MTRFHEQMKMLRDETEDYDNVWPMDDWTIQDYKDMFWCIEPGYLVQGCGTSFMINEEWDRDDIYAEEFIPEKPKCYNCGTSQSRLTQNDKYDGECVCQMCWADAEYGTRTTYCKCDTRCGEEDCPYQEEGLDHDGDFWWDELKDK